MCDTTMATNYIYLLQEREFLKTKENIFKVGMTTKQNHERFNQYPKGSILLFQLICDNCKNIEKQIITIFKENFIQRKDIGTEYFQGNYKLMIDSIYLTIKNEIVTEIKEDFKVAEVNVNKDEKVMTIEEYITHVKSKTYQDEAFKKLCEKIIVIFPNYNDDISFGGNKQFIKLELIDNSYICSYINPDIKTLIYSDDGDIYCSPDYYDNEIHFDITYDAIICVNLSNLMCDENDVEYFSKLINENAILLNEIYDINSQKFIKNINKTKMNVNIENYDEFINLHKFNDKIDINNIYNILCFNVVINNKMYASIENKIFKKIQKIKDFDDIHLHVKEPHQYISYKHVTLYKINKKFYDRHSFIRKYIPYCITWDINNDYYIVNRDYEYIGLNCKVIDCKFKGTCYLFNDGTTPWSSKLNYIRMCNEYMRIKEENSLIMCKNPFNPNVILSLLD